MGKQGSPRSPRPEVQKDKLSLGMKEYKLRSSETGNDPPLGRRVSGGDYYWNSKPASFHGSKNDSFGKYGSYKGNNHVGKKHIWLRNHLKSIALMFVFMAFFFLLDSFMVSIFESLNLQSSSAPEKSSWIKVQ